jgi:methyl-accepting chemotaxis protein
MFKNLPIKWKIRTLVCALLLAMAAIGVSGLLGIQRLGAAIDEIGMNRLPSVEGLLVLSEAQTAVKAATLSTAIYENDYAAQALFRKVIGKRQEAWKDAGAGWKMYEPLPQTSDEAVMWKQFVGEWEAWKRADGQLEATIAALADSKDEATQKDLFVRFYQQYAASLPAFDKAEATLNRIVELNQKIAAEAVADGTAARADARNLMLAIAAAVVLASLAGAAYISATITRPIDAAVHVAQTVSAGDLRSLIEVETTDETGKLLLALKQMNDSLTGIVGEVRIGTDAIATASGQIAAGNLDLSSRTEEQASSLEETAASMEELTSTVKQNAENARQANALALSASEVASKGGAVVAQVVDTMSTINDSSRRIADIITVIEGIAFQTNILALNAAVEAARAGEEGRGFAVVAGEVRSLAHRSASAAKDIKALISDSAEKVESGSRLVDEAGQTMGEIVASVRRVTDIMNEILAATLEQSAGIEQINQAVVQMDDVTQQNAALVEEAAAASDAMQKQAGRLAEVVSVFRLRGEAQAQTAPARPGRRAVALAAPRVPRKA